MSSPFAGMDPYLEQTSLWPSVHHRLVVALANLIGPQIRPRYYVEVEERVYALDSRRGRHQGFEGRPDVTVARETEVASYAAPGAAAGRDPATVRLPRPRVEREPYLEIRDASGGEVVTVIELLSHSNKQPGNGRRSYLDKRAVIFDSGTNLVEIDLLRAGDPMPVEPPRRPGTYSILVSRAVRYPEADIYVFGVRDAIPVFPVPLRQGDPEPPVALKAALDRVYEDGGYALRIDYGSDPPPPLSSEDAAWVRDVALGVQGFGSAITRQTAGGRG